MGEYGYSIGPNVFFKERTDRRIPINELGGGGALKDLYCVSNMQRINSINGPPGYSPLMCVFCMSFSSQYALFAFRLPRWYSVETTCRFLIFLRGLGILGAIVGGCAVGILF